MVHVHVLNNTISHIKITQFNLKNQSHNLIRRIINILLIVVVLWKIEYVKFIDAWENQVHGATICGKSGQM